MTILLHFERKGQLSLTQANKRCVADNPSLAPQRNLRLNALLLCSPTAIRAAQMPATLVFFPGLRHQRMLGVYRPFVFRHGKVGAYRPTHCRKSS